MESLGPGFPDPFSSDRTFNKAFWHAILATALFRCWHILIFFAAWSTTICVISDTTKNLGIAPTLLTVFVAVLSLFHLDKGLPNDLQPRYRPRFRNFLQNDIEFREVQRGTKVLVPNCIFYADLGKVDLVPCPG